jgi:gamma-glutamyltranspeptidase/glutathione hydrolase
VREEPIYSTRFGDVDLYTCGPWCQGPVLLQALNVVKRFDLSRLAHNSTAYVHIVIEALKLAFADRECHYGDPRFVDVPMQGLLSDEYSTFRASLVDRDKAWPELPPGGDPHDFSRKLQAILPPPSLEAQPLPGDTSYVCVVDSSGNAFSATPSDPSNDTPVIPGTGLALSSRGAQSWVHPEHPAAVAPGKRPRLTPNPAMALRDGKAFMPFGTPSGDVQTQAMLQVFLNITAFRMEPQEAVEQPRFCTYSFPDSFEPHRYYPGQVNLERPICPDIGAALGALGHTVGWWPEMAWRSGGVCAIVVDPETGVLKGAADPRRNSYAMGC